MVAFASLNDRPFTYINYLFSLSIPDCDQPLPPMNGSVDNVTTELGGRITFRCNDGFLPSQVMTAVCQTTGWSQDPALLECFHQGIPTFFWPDVC